MTKINWKSIETVLLDMDGVLIDKNHDDFFWDVMIPESYARERGLSLEIAKKQLSEKFRSQQNTMNWGSHDYWEKELNMGLWDLKHQAKDLAQLHPHAVKFLRFLKDNEKRVYLVSAADPKDIQFKIGDKNISLYLDGIISQVIIGASKEDESFWKLLEKKLEFNKETTMLAEDNPKILKIAQKFGIKWLVFKTLPNSKKPKNGELKDFINVEHFDEIMP